MLAAQLGSTASILFKDAKEASGLVDVAIAEFKDVKLADLMSKTAKASIVYGVKDLRLDGPVPSALAAALRWGDQGIVGNIKGATLQLDNGMAYQDMTLSLLKQVEERNEAGAKEKRDTQETIRFVGGINLQNNTFHNYKLVISKGLLLRDWREAHPNGMEIELRGKVDDINSILTQAIAQLAIKGEGTKLIEKGLEGLIKKKK